MKTHSQTEAVTETKTGKRTGRQSETAGKTELVCVREKVSKIHPFSRFTHKVIQAILQNFIKNKFIWQCNTNISISFFVYLKKFLILNT